jgi:DNA mismatch endonuclease (patch repair protein)
MSRIRQRDTALEIVVRRWVTALGARFRVRNQDLPGSPDLANRTKRWAIYVHGCFWHGHAGCRAARLPRTNRPFWVAKIEDNRKRDSKKLRELRRLGFRVLVIWGCQIRGNERKRQMLIARLTEFIRPSLS